MKRELAAPLEEPAIQIRCDQALSKLEQRTLREHGLDRSEAIEHHLPAQVEQRQLHGGRIRRAGVGLQQHHHRHQRGRMGVLAGTSVSVHRFELELERAVEQLIAVLPKKRIELSIPLEPSEDELLLARDDLTRTPALDSHRERGDHEP